MPTSWDVLGIGCVAVDDLIYVDQVAVPDSKQPVREVRRQGGGNTATALVAVARLGASAAYCASLGHDDLSDYSVQALEREGVDCSLCSRTGAGRPFHSFIIAERATHTRTILYETGVVAPPLEAVRPAVERCRVLLVDHFAGLTGLEAARLARGLAIPVVADVEDESRPGAEALLDEADHLIIGQALARRLTGAADVPAMLRALSRPHRVCCAVTAGEAGCWFAERGGPAHFQAAFRVEVADSTGCGDVFHGAYAAGLARGESVARAIEQASAVAALKAAHPGGRAGIPRWAEVEKFLARPTEGGWNGSRG
jgi:sulfofructose kinase